MLALLGDPTRRDALGRAAREAAAQLTWGAGARATLGALLEAAA